MATVLVIAEQSKGILKKASFSALGAVRAGLGVARYPWVFFTDGEPNGQMRGPLTLRYSIVPLAGVPDFSRLGELGQQLAAGLRSVQLRAADVAIYRSEKTVPAVAGFIQVDSRAVVTSLRQIGRTVELRMFNPYAESIPAKVRLTVPAAAKRPFSKAEFVNFESRPVGPFKLTKSQVAVTLKPKQIVTVRLS